MAEFEVKPEGNGTWGYVYPPTNFAMSGDTPPPPVAAETPERIAERWADKNNSCSSHGVTYYMQMALRDQARQYEARIAELEGELRAIDDRLSRRPAIADLPTRSAKIERMCAVAGKAESAEAECAELKQLINKWGWKKEWDKLRAERDAAVGQVAVLAEIVRAHNLQLPVL